MPITVTSWKL